MSWELLYAVLMIELKFLHVKLYISAWEQLQQIHFNR